MSARSQLVQARVPAEVATWLRERAEADGITVAGWLRCHLIREVAETAPVAACVEACGTGPHCAARYLLQPLREVGDARIFVLLDEDTRKPVALRVVMASPWWKHRREDYCFRLHGRHERWFATTTLWDCSNKRLEVTLVAE